MCYDNIEYDEGDFGMHDDHRQRVRERFLSAGLQSFPPHNVLELLLFYSIPRRDTNEIAHRLLNHFGSLTNVLDAPTEELCKVDGIGQSSAVLISLVAQLARRYLAEQSNEAISFHSTQQFRQYVISKFIGQKSEIVYLFCLDNAGHLLHSCPVSLGTKYAVNLDNRTLLEIAFRHNATKIVMAHNHPNGVCSPSRSDVQLTEAAVRLYQDVNIQLLDHLIVAGGECCSMASNPKFGRIFLGHLRPGTQQKAADVID